MNILVTGKNGQIGLDLIKKLSPFGNIIGIGRNDIDLRNIKDLIIFLSKEKPDLIIHTAAYTKVDQAESESLLCCEINIEATRILVNKAIELQVPFIYFSTDYVFDGSKKEPYLEEDKTNPQSVYACSKYEGEKVVREYQKHIILRTGWVFSIHRENFLKTVLSLIQEKNLL